MFKKFLFLVVVFLSLGLTFADEFCTLEIDNIEKIIVQENEESAQKYKDLSKEHGSLRSFLRVPKNKANEVYALFKGLSREQQKIIKNDLKQYYRDQEIDRGRFVSATEKLFNDFLEKIEKYLIASKKDSYEIFAKEYKEIYITEQENKLDHLIMIIEYKKKCTLDRH